MSEGYTITELGLYKLEANIPNLSFFKSYETCDELTGREFRRTEAVDGWEVLLPGDVVFPVIKFPPNDTKGGLTYERMD